MLTQLRDSLMRKEVVYMAKTMVGGFDGDDWRKFLALAAFLAAIGVLPKGWSKMIATAGGLAALYKLLRDLGIIR